jgi:hypothetical protein
MCIVHRYKHLYLFLLILYFLPLFLLLLGFYFLKLRHFLCVCPPFNLFQYTYIYICYYDCSSDSMEGFFSSLFWGVSVPSCEAVGNLRGH